MTNPIVTFNTRKYEMAHGKKPKGYGLWCFDVNGCGMHLSSQNSLSMQMQATGTLTDAKRKVKREIAGMAKANYGVVAKYVNVDILS